MEITRELLLLIIQISIAGIILMLLLMLKNYLNKKNISTKKIGEKINARKINARTFFANVWMIMKGIYSDIQNFIDNILNRFPKGNDDESVSFLTAVAYGLYTIVGWFLTIIFLVVLGIGGAYLTMYMWNQPFTVESANPFTQLSRLLIGLLGALITLVCIISLLSISLAVAYKWLVDIRIRGNKPLVDTNKTLIRILHEKFSEDEKDLIKDSSDKKEKKKTSKEK